MPLDVFLRGKVWYMRGTVRPNTDDSISVYQSTGTTDKRQAQVIAAQTENRLIEETIHGKIATVTFLEAALAYISAGGSSRFLGTEDTGLCGALGKMRLAAIKQEDLDNASAKLYPNALPETRLRQFYTPFTAVWNHAVKENWAKPRKWRRPKKPKGTNVVRLKAVRSGSAPTSYERAAEFVAAMSPAPAMLMTSLFFTGMRPIELFALESGDVNVKGRWIVVRNSKTGEPRGVPMHDFLAPLFESLLSRNSLALDPRVFRTPRGEPYPILENMGGQMKTAILGARKRSGIKDISPYTARHTVSTQLVVNGVHPYVKDQILGHAVDDMSRRYTNIPQQPLIDAINGIAVPDTWRGLAWWADPLGWSSKLAGEQGKRNDLKEKRA